MSDRRWLLALHSSTECLGVGVLDLAAAPQAEPPRLEAFPLGRDLSNQLFACVEAVLPASEWPHLARLAVATGPGGFTGTRLTVVLARTLAQQLALPLDGVSSFLLIARRLVAAGLALPFWLEQPLPRHGLVAGLYSEDPLQPGSPRERLCPRLYREAGERAAAAAAAGLAGAPVHAAAASLPEDVGALLSLSRAAALRGEAAPWQTVLPLYPTSPVGG
ncbi:MAG: tRNA (adenosine(37)-N6)-threonylcarbamoyltransferase complex dimerization subunit type 1 TsaB [Synechococcaceae cyanobacterium]|nr:tRNA (adenosine(37)-N6)-threonylcarbamoyltransferase complex dimerization subunit type 1 TsaB [Synechococcaceae cyanobacterium]